MIKNVKSIVISFILALFTLPVTVIAEETFQTEVQSRLDSLTEDTSYLKIDSQIIYSSPIITKLYQSNGYQLIWNNKLIPVLRKEILKLQDDGLNPDDYWLPSIDILLNKQQQGLLDISSSVDLDLLLSENFFRAYYNLLIGKVDPEALDKNFNFSQPFDRKDIRPKLIALLEDGKVEEILKQARPTHKRYDSLKNVLARYREYQNTGSWVTIQSGKTLRLGDKNTRISQVRAQLITTNDYIGTTENPELFDV
ncbi:MAG TPA: hypothetical protein ENK70_07905, partial [Methylophaga sp.]|nr:hypothetical protein [Methylophaga sp.]